LEITPLLEHDRIVFEYRELWHFVTMYIKLQFFRTILPAKLLGGVSMQALLNCCCGLDVHKDIYRLAF